MSNADEFISRAEAVCVWYSEYTQHLSDRDSSVEPDLSSPKLDGEYERMQSHVKWLNETLKSTADLESLTRYSCFLRYKGMYNEIHSCMRMNAHKETPTHLATVWMPYFRALARIICACEEIVVIEESTTRHDTNSKYVTCAPVKP